MENKSVYELIIDALEEAKVLESALDTHDENRMLFVAQKLSGAPFSFIEQVYQQNKC